MDLITLAVANKFAKSYTDSQIENADFSSMSYYCCSSGEYNSSTGVPTISSPDANTFYITPAINSNGVYNMYIYKNNQWVLFHTCDVDLTEFNNEITSIKEDLSESVSDLKSATGALEQSVNATVTYAFTDNVNAGSNYKGYTSGKKKVNVEIPVGGNYSIEVSTSSFVEYELYVLLEGVQSYSNIGTKSSNSVISLRNNNAYKITSLTLWAKAANVTVSGSFEFAVTVPNQNGLIPRMENAESNIEDIETDIDDLEERITSVESGVSGAESSIENIETDIDGLDERIANIESDMSGEVTYYFEDNISANGEYKGYNDGKKKIEVAIPPGMRFTYRVDTECFARYKLYFYTNQYYGDSNNVNVNQDLMKWGGYQGLNFTKVTIHVPKTNDLTGTTNVTTSGTFRFSVTIKTEKSYDITKLNPQEEMLPKIQNARVSTETSGHTGSNRYKCLTLAHLSDIHADGDNLKRIVDFCAEYTDYIEDIVCTGDLVRDHAIASGVEEDFSWWHDSGADYVLSVIGNHDTASYSGGSYDWRGFGKVNTYNKYFAPFISNWNVTQPEDAATEGKCYYYKDYSTYGIRVIVLDCMYYDTDEDTWFASVLDSAKTAGYAVIVCAHGLGKTGQSTACNFTSLTGTGGQVIVDTSTYIYNANVHDKVDAFITAGGTFICFLGGHFHKDYFGVVSNTINIQPFILIDTAAYNAPERDHAVTKFERSQDCFNIVSFDTRLHLIKIVRVGFQFDCWMRKRETLCYNYDTHTLIKD